MQQPPNNQPWQQPQQPNTFYPSQQPQYPPPPNTYYPPQPWQQPPMIPPPPPPRPPRKKQHLLLTLAILAGVFLIIGVINNAISKSSPEAQATPTTDIVQATDTPLATATLDTSIPTDTPAPTAAPAKWTTTQRFSGTGDKQTGVFTVPADWKIMWSCDATHNYGVEGVLAVYIYNSDGSPADDGNVDGTCTANKVTTDNTEEHQSGDVYLKVLASVPWTVQIQEFQ